MKRRNFLKSLPVFAVAPLTLSASPKNASNSRHLIALGSAACRLAYMNFERLPFNTVTFIDREEPGLIGDRQTIIPSQPMENLFDRETYYSVRNKVSLPVLTLDPEIPMHLQTLNGDLIFLAGLGGITASLLSQSIGFHYFNPSQRMEWLAMMPFEFEGTKKVVQAQLVIHVLIEKRINPSLLYLDDIREKYGNLAIRSAYQKADEWVVEELLG